MTEFLDLLFSEVIEDIKELSRCLEGWEVVDEDRRSIALVAYVGHTMAVALERHGCGKAQGYGKEAEQIVEIWRKTPQAVACFLMDLAQAMSEGRYTKGAR